MMKHAPGWVRTSKLHVVIRSPARYRWTTAPAIGGGGGGGGGYIGTKDHNLHLCSNITPESPDDKPDTNQINHCLL